MAPKVLRSSRLYSDRDAGIKKFRLSVFRLTTSGQSNFTTGRIAAVYIPYTLQCTAPSSPQNCPFPWFLGPTQVHNQKSISIGLAVFAGLTTVKDRQTEQQITPLRL